MNITHDYFIILKVEAEYSEAKVIGDHTLKLLNSSIANISKSLKCFNDSKQLALEANRVANLAYKQIINASKVRQPFYVFAFEDCDVFRLLHNFRIKFAEKNLYRITYHYGEKAKCLVSSRRNLNLILNFILAISICSSKQKLVALIANNINKGNSYKNLSSRNTTSIVLGCLF